MFYVWIIWIFKSKKIKQYNIKVNENIIEYNKKYIRKILVKYKEYFDSLIKEFDPNIQLDLEQKNAILTDEDYNSIDFEDMITLAIQKIKDNPNNISIKYKHVIIDEYQDISNKDMNW